MGTAIANLAAMLAAKGEAMDRLLSLLDNECRLVTSLDMGSLAENDCQLESLLQEIALLTRRCRQQLRAAAADNGLLPESTFSQLLDRVDPHERDELGRLRERLFCLGAELQRRVDVSSAILGKSLASVGRSITLMTQGLNPAATYGEAGRMVTGTGFGIYRKEI